MRQLQWLPAYLLFGLLVCTSGCSCQNESHEVEPAPVVPIHNGPAWDVFFERFGYPDPARLKTYCDASLKYSRDMAGLLKSMQDEESTRDALQKLNGMNQADAALMHHLAVNYFPDADYDHLKPELRDPMRKLRSGYLAAYDKAKQEANGELTRIVQDLDILAALSSSGQGALGLGGVESLGALDGSGAGGGLLSGLVSPTVTIRFIDVPPGVTQVLKWQVTDLLGGYSDTKASTDVDGRVIALFTAQVPPGVTADLLMPMARKRIDFGQVAQADARTIDVLCDPGMLPIAVPELPGITEVSQNPDLLDSVIAAMIDCRNPDRMARARSLVDQLHETQSAFSPEQEQQICANYEKLIRQELPIALPGEQFKHLTREYLPLYCELCDEEIDPVQVVLDATQHIDDADYRVALFQLLEDARPGEPALIEYLFANLDIAQFRSEVKRQGGGVSLELVGYLLEHGKNDTSITREMADVARGICRKGTFDEAAVPTMIDAYDNAKGMTRDFLFEAIEATGDERTVPLLIAAYKVSRDRFGDKTMRLVDAIKKIGPAAEKPVIDILMTSNEPGVWSQCIEILRVVGTSESIPALKQYMQRFAGTNNATAAGKAIDEILQRSDEPLSDADLAEIEKLRGASVSGADTTEAAAPDDNNTEAATGGQATDTSSDNTPGFSGDAIGTRIAEQLAGMSPQERYDLAEQQLKQLGSWLYQVGQGLKEVRDTTTMASVASKIRKIPTPPDQKQREMVLDSLSQRQRDQLNQEYTDKFQQVVETIGAQTARLKQERQIWDGIGTVRQLYQQNTAGLPLSDPFK